jgi:pimeloyl-ACP methyl ester carboxylesterase
MVESFENTPPAEKVYISEEDFEKQFVERTTTIDGHDIHFAIIEPKEAISSQYVVYIGGLGHEFGAYKEEIRDIVRSGRGVVFLNPLKGFPPSDEDHAKLNEWDIPATMQNKAAETLALLNHVKISRADVVGHSQGATVGAIVAALRPEIADNLVLHTPGGLRGDDTAIGVTARAVLGEISHRLFSMEETDPIERERISEARRQVEGHNALSGSPFSLSPEPWWRIIHEVPGLVATDILPVLKHLKDSQREWSDDKKTTVTLLTANKDLTYPPEKIEEHIGLIHADDKTDKAKIKEMSESYEKAFRNVIDRYAMYANKEAWHKAPMYERAGLLPQLLNPKQHLEKLKKIR